VKKLRLALSDAAIADILEQSDWYETQADRNLVKRWEDAVSGTLYGSSRSQELGHLVNSWQPNFVVLAVCQSPQGLTST
jgi:hypothetical protein